MAEGLDPRLNFHQSLFWRRQIDAARKEEAGQRLEVPSAQSAPRPEGLNPGLRSPHGLILNGRDSVAV